MFDPKVMFAWTFSLCAGTLIMIVLKLIFYGSSFVTLLLAATTAINCAFLMTTYREETLRTLSKLFIWK
ncbi:hypothetical protein GCM10008018_64850 [Paenibacillus marchantiophytorum]|uniref:Uncharacterized protein n=1 Tax=Paenibacillus marchantiophytorum TaxID=1619310 RepID=A0ABQ1FF99_9BACL|nr:hypothetical protein GCM10008018_64850 [Paenibacillus marchantiophytorum]